MLTGDQNHEKNEKENVKICCIAKLHASLKNAELKVVSRKTLSAKKKNFFLHQICLTISLLTLPPSLFWIEKVVSEQKKGLGLLDFLDVVNSAYHSLDAHCSVFVCLVTFGWTSWLGHALAVRGNSWAPNYLVLLGTNLGVTFVQIKPKRQVDKYIDKPKCGQKWVDERHRVFSFTHLPSAEKRKRKTTLLVVSAHVLRLLFCTKQVRL